LRTLQISYPEFISGSDQNQIKIQVSKMLKQVQHGKSRTSPYKLLSGIKQVWVKGRKK